ncbi:hypothetical protein MM50RIKEN_13380 [Vescimonas coprocola]|uniref:Uncharacterized protein n=1 Tax=Vescimonas coprocola TaxID=2714355 RepID=A0A810Q4U1_9FIRM|nr:hypothetical protein MM50RIKEN_13380 [Vescimonas coprocola]
MIPQIRTYSPEHTICGEDKQTQAAATHKEHIGKADNGNEVRKSNDTDDGGVLWRYAKAIIESTVRFGVVVNEGKTHNAGDD